MTLPWQGHPQGYRPPPAEAPWSWGEFMFWLVLYCVGVTGNAALLLAGIQWVLGGKP